MTQNSASFTKFMETKLKKLSETPLSLDSCIYRVPERLRQNNEKAYTPLVVSIGPLHRDGEKLQFMEEHKQRYLIDFLQRTEISLDQFVRFIKDKEEKLRGCYSEEIHLSSYQFVEMILVDATFIIEVLLRYSCCQFRKDNDYIFNKPFLIEDIWYDMWLIENQLPFFILEEIFNKAAIHNVPPGFNVIRLTYEYFKSLEAVKDNWHKVQPPTKVAHFTDFLRICHLPSGDKQQPNSKTHSINNPHQDGGKDQMNSVKIAPSIIDLHQAGVKFKVRSSSDNANELFDINFKNGVLEIPKLRLQLETESLFRNMIAYEQRHYSENYINDYVFLIHHLVNSPKDVELLIQNGIIENWLPDKEGASTLINNLSRGTTLLPHTFYFSFLCEGLNIYCKSTGHKWRANLKQNYFNTPWSGISVFAAVFLILLTVTQTVSSVLQMLQLQPKNCS